MRRRIRRVGEQAQGARWASSPLPFMRYSLSSPPRRRPLIRPAPEGLPRLLRRRYAAPFFIPTRIKSHTEYAVDKYKSDFAQEFPLDEPGSSFFSLARKRVQRLDWIQYQVDIYLANEMSMDLWEYTGFDFHHTVRIPFHPSDPRYRAMFDDRECTH